MKSKKAKTFHFITHTHWDREWYQEYEKFRMILVDLIDELIDLMEHNPDYKYFHLDGQTVVLEDYLEIRPENRDRLTELIRQKRIFIGPWYVLPDEFLVSGEALIRNLLFGHKIGNRFGGIMKVGYIPDSFGHISQLPQIFKGFDIDNVILWRGFGGEKGKEYSEYTWRSPDGTEVLMIHLPPGGYGKGYLNTMKKDEIIEKWKRISNILIPRAQTNHILCMQGSDHLWPYPQLSDIIKILNDHYDDTFVHSNLEKYVAEIKSSRVNFSNVEGEFLAGYDYAFILQGVYSSRMYLKQMNNACQTLLERFAEPLNVIARIHGNSSLSIFINLAWKYLLQNHPHDSICGCSIDAVHREMMTRFEKCLQITNQIISNSISQLALIPINTEQDIYFYIFNPKQYQSNELVECQINLPISPKSNKDNFHKNMSYNFNIMNSENHEIPFQILNCGKDYELVYSKHDYHQQKPIYRISVLIDAQNLPALGFKQFKLIPQTNNSRYDNKLEVGRFYLENKFVKVEVSEWAVVKVTDKINGYTYNKLNIFEDTADVGDEYNYSYPANDGIFLSKQFKPRLSLIENGPLRGAIRIRTRMKIPDQASDDKKSRSKQKAVLKLSSIVYLEYNSPVIYFKTTVINNIKDHRLRVLFQTGVRTSESHAETAFHVIKRKHRKVDPSNYKLEIPSSTHLMQRFVTIVDDKKGFTLFSKGLPEYELKLDGQGTLALTLLRSVGKLSGSNLITRPGGNAGPEIETPEAQCQGNYTFNYAILSHRPEFDRELEKIYDYAEQYILKSISVQKQNIIKQLSSTLIIEPRILRLSAFKETEDGKGALIRLYNPCKHNINGSFQFHFPFKKAYLTNLNESELKELEILENKKINIRVNAFSILSCKLICLS